MGPRNWGFVLWLNSFLIWELWKRTREPTRKSCSWMVVEKCLTNLVADCFLAFKTLAEISRRSSGSFCSCWALYCITPALDVYITLLDRTPHTQTMTSLNICGMDFCDHLSPCLHLSLFYLHPSTLLPSGLLLSEPSIHWQNISSADPHEALDIIHGSCDLMLTCGTVHCGGNVGIVVEEKDNRNSKGDKVPLGDSKGATHGKMYLRSLIWLGLMHPPFWFPMLESKRLHSYYWKETLKIIISEGLNTSSKLPHTISILDSMTCNMEGHMKLIDRLSSPSDQLIHVSHICLSKRHWPNWTSCGSFASEYTALQFSTLTSVKKAHTVSKVLPTYLLRSKSWIQAGWFTANCLTMPYSMIHNEVLGWCGCI